MKFMADSSLPELFKDIKKGTKVIVRTRNDEVYINSNNFSEGIISRIYPCKNIRSTLCAKFGCKGYMDIKINGKIIKEKCVAYSTHDNKSCIYAWEEKEDQFIDELEMTL